MTELLRTLIVEDSEDDTLLLVEHLREGGYDVQWRRVDAADTLSAALDDERWDVIFADYTMPRFSGSEALNSVRQRGLDVPFIFVSGTIGEDTAVSAMRAGAEDYIMKGNFKRLVPAVNRALREARFHREQKRAEQEVQLLRTITRAASEAGDVAEALSATLTKVCKATPFVLALAWVPSSNGARIECSSAWYCCSDGPAEFRATNVGLSFAPGEGLPGLAWSSLTPMWTLDVTRGHYSRRGQSAHQAGLGAALAVPVTIDDNVLAVLEFFLDEPREQDEQLIQLVSATATQLASVLQRKHAEERLHYLAHYDTLTELPNRLLFTDRLQQMIYEARRNRRLVGVAFVDLDRFKTINDSLGHSIGDALLKAVGQRLARNLRSGDTVARLAGDEFTLALSNMGTFDHAARVAQKILDSFEQSFHVMGHELYTSVSLGMTLHPLDTSDVEGLLRNADIAMYRAKERGGNAYEFYAPEMTAKAQARLTLENGLRQALEHDEFVLHYQPLIDLGNGQIVGAEALVRWQHPERGLITPDEFITVAEETGAISRLGQWVLHEACAQPWLVARNARETPPRLSVNVSPIQFHGQDFTKSIAQTLKSSGAKPSQLNLEITETSLMTNAGMTIDAMHEVGALGVRFSVDDFGTGYSSLAYLKHLPISHVKIDRSFISDIPDDPNDIAIVRAVIAMAHSLGIQVIAEGVETRDQFEFLRNQNCDAAQGYYFSRPVSSNKFAQLLEQDGPRMFTSN